MEIEDTKNIKISIDVLEFLAKEQCPTLPIEFRYNINCDRIEGLVHFVTSCIFNPDVSREILLYQGNVCPVLTTKVIKALKDLKIYIDEKLLEVQNVNNSKNSKSKSKIVNSKLTEKSNTDKETN